MAISDADHNDAIQKLIANPGDSGLAQRVFELAAADPEGAHHARERVMPAPPAIPLDVVTQPFRRHNLALPYTPEAVAQPGSLDELVSTMQAAATAWEPMKAIGDGYGFANTGSTKGYLFPMVSKLTRVLPFAAGELKADVDAAHLFRFEGGATIDIVTQSLWALGKAVYNQPGYERLTFVGTMSSGGHGSGIWCGPLSEHAVALHIVTLDAQGKVVQFQVERSPGISDPVAFKAQHPGVDLIQNDDKLFDACSVAMGCLGIIYSATIKVRDKYNIRETRTKLRWREIKERLPALLAEQGPGKQLHSIEVWINPYLVDGEVWGILGERAETNAPPAGERALVIEYGGPEFLYNLIAWWVAHEPKATPGLINAAMSATESGVVVMEAPKGLNFGAPNLAPVTAASCGVPVAGIGDLVDQLTAFFQARAAQTQSYITSPLGLRFVHAASAPMSPSYGRDTCMIEVPILLGTPRARDTLDAYHDFLAPFGGRPHWGQVNDMPPARLDELYPRLQDFLDVFQALNPKGFFDNDFTEQLHLRRR
jgi:hypothetical protein